MPKEGALPYRHSTFQRNTNTMVNRNLIRSLEDDTLETELQGLFGGEAETSFDLALEQEADFEVNNIIDGIIVSFDDEYVVIDVGFKSEGSISRNEWGQDDDQPEVGGSVQVLILSLIHISEPTRPY